MYEKEGGASPEGGGPAAGLPALAEKRYASEGGIFAVALCRLIPALSLGINEND